MIRGSIADLTLSYGPCRTNRASWVDVLGSTRLYLLPSFLSQICLVELLWKKSSPHCYRTEWAFHQGLAPSYQFWYFFLSMQSPPLFSETSLSGPCLVRQWDGWPSTVADAHMDTRSTCAGGWSWELRGLIGACSSGSRLPRSPHSIALSWDNGLSGLQDVFQWVRAQIFLFIHEVTLLSILEDVVWIHSVSIAAYACVIWSRTSRVSGESSCSSFGPKSLIWTLHSLVPFSKCSKTIFFIFSSSWHLPLSPILWSQLWRYLDVGVESKLTRWGTCFCL